MKRRTESKNENEWVSTTLMKACGKIGKQTKRKDKERERTCKKDVLYGKKKKKKKKKKKERKKERKK